MWSDKALVRGTILIWIIIGVLASMFAVYHVRALPAYTIDGDVVYIDDQNAYIAVYPHTVYESQWIHLNVTSKRYSGSIDVCFGFDRAKARPASLERWTGVWSPLALDFTKRTWEFQEMNTWYLTSAPVVANTTYHLRFWLTLTPTYRAGDVKYLIALKPSAETFAEAFANGHLYVLDPWWNNSWDYRMQLTFDNTASTENLTNFPVYVHLNDARMDWDHVNSSGQDVRFVDSDDTTELDFEIEEWDDTNDAYIFVEVPQIDAGSNTDHVFMYYGNSAAADGQDAEGTWNDDYIFVGHLRDGANTSHIYDSTQYDNDGTKQGAGDPAVNTGSYISDGQSFGGSAHIEIGCSGLLVTAGTFEALAYPVGNGPSADEFIVMHRYASTNSRIYVERKKSDNDEYYNGLGASGALDTNTVLDQDEWHVLAFTWSGANYVSYVNGSSVKSGSASQPSNADTSAWVGDYKTTNQGFNGTIDEVRLSNVSRSGEWIEATHLTITDQFITYAGEETRSVTTTAYTTITTTISEQTTTTGGTSIFSELMAYETTVTSVNAATAVGTSTASVTASTATSTTDGPTVSVIYDVSVTVVVTQQESEFLVVWYEGATPSSNLAAIIVALLILIPVIAVVIGRMRK